MRVMSVYTLISSLLSYVFTTIIYLFIFSVIALIYMDIKKASKKEKKQTLTDHEEIQEQEEPKAVLRTVKTKKAADAKMKTAYRISGRGVIVGRGKECDITVNHMFLSIEHFQIWYDEGCWYIGDMGSKNGTYLNGSKLKKVKPLSDGDEISFGEISVIFEEE